MKTHTGNTPKERELGWIFEQFRFWCLQYVHTSCRRLTEEATGATSFGVGILYKFSFRMYGTFLLGDVNYGLIGTNNFLLTAVLRQSSLNEAQLQRAEQKTYLVSICTRCINFPTHFASPKRLVENHSLKFFCCTSPDFWLLHNGLLSPRKCT